MAYSAMVVVTYQTIFHSKTYATETSQNPKVHAYLRVERLEK